MRGLILIRIKTDYFKKHSVVEDGIRRFVDYNRIDTCFQFRKRKQERLEGNYFTIISYSRLIQMMTQYRLKYGYAFIKSTPYWVYDTKDKEYKDIAYKSLRYYLCYNSERIGIGVYLAMVMNSINEERQYRWDGNYHRPKNVW